jgi:hypothetical protein
MVLVQTREDISRPELRHDDVRSIVKNKICPFDPSEFSSVLFSFLSVLLYFQQPWFSFLERNPLETVAGQSHSRSTHFGLMVSPGRLVNKSQGFSLLNKHTISKLTHSVRLSFEKERESEIYKLPELNKSLVE